MRRQIPLLLVFVSGVFMVIQYFVPSAFAERAYEFLIDWTIIIGIFALALGIWSLVRVSYNKIRTGHPDAMYSAITLAGLGLMIFFGFEFPGVSYKEAMRVTQAKDYIQSEFSGARDAAARRVFLPESDTLSLRPDSIKTILTMAADSVAHWVDIFKTSHWFSGADLEGTNLAAIMTTTEQFKSISSQYTSVSPSDSMALAGLAGRVSEVSQQGIAAVDSLKNLSDVYPLTGGLENYWFIHFFDDVMIPIQATMFSLLAFFIASAAYRAFRARSLLSTVLLLAAFIVMARLLPMGPVTIGANKLTQWILLVPNLAAKRAIVIGVGLGIVATSLKVVLGIERSYMGRD